MFIIVFSFLFFLFSYYPSYFPLLFPFHHGNSPAPPPISPSAGRLPRRRAPSAPADRLYLRLSATTGRATPFTLLLAAPAPLPHPSSPPRCYRRGRIDLLDPLGTAASCVAALEELVGSEAVLLSTAGIA
jgi:hypothetical protein